ncbi:hypothetical protein Tco_1426685, partial [Tanacetum coccineum]
RILKNLLDRVSQLYYPFSLPERLKANITIRVNRFKLVRYGVSKGLDMAYWSFLEYGYAVSSLMDMAYWVSE